MNGKRFGKGVIKSTLWGAVAYSTFVLGAGIEKVGEGLAEDPLLVFLSIPMILAGNIVKAATIVPGIGVILNAAEAAVEFIPSPKESTNER